MNNFWCVSVIFNPSGYRSRIDNYHVFKERLDKQKINLLTIDLAFNDQDHSLPRGDRILHLKSHSIMWQKERLINYAISQLPPECTKFAWLDADLLLPDGWDELLQEKLNTSDFVQLFEEISYLKPKIYDFDGDSSETRKSIVWQCKTYKENWIPLRLSKALPHSQPGFGWGAKRGFHLYDKLICGSGDNFLADCLLNSKPIHHYWTKLTKEMLEDMEEWKLNFIVGTADYLPIKICHLWHGSLKDRAYETRDLIFKKYDFNPRIDIKTINNVWEWNSNKPELHKAVSEYFHNRKEDGQNILVPDNIL